MAQDQKTAARMLRRFEEGQRTRFYIAFSCAGSHTGQYPGSHRRYVWPLLFKTEDDAHEFANMVNPFRNVAAIPGRGRIKSYTVEKTVLQQRR